MKPYDYYQTTSVSIPRKDDYMTIYYYRKGVMIGMKVGKVEDDFKPPKNCVEEKVLDEISFNAHMKHYQEENLKFQEEFREDLIDKYNMSKHHKANKLFDKSWYLGSGNLEEVEYYFRDLVELFQDDETNSPKTFIDMMIT